MSFDYSNEQSSNRSMSSSPSAQSRPSQSGRRSSSSSDNQSISQPNSRSSPPLDLPCLIVPTTVDFRRETNPVVLTLYNPYNLNLRFVVLSTNPNVVAVTPARGNLTRQSSVQLIVKARSNQAFNQPNNQVINQIALRVDLTNDRDEVVGQQTLPVKNLPSFGQAIEQTTLPQIKTRDNTPITPSSDSPKSSVLMHSLSLIARLLPLTVGVALIGLLIESDETITPTAKIWMTFCIGLITGFLQCKFLEIQR